MSFDWETRPGVDWLAVEADIRSPLAVYFWASVMFLVGLCGTIGNAFVITVICTDPTVSIEKQLSNLPVLSLAFTDIVCSVLVILPGAVSIWFDKPIFPIDSVLCPIQTFLNITCICASVQTMVVISVDRYLCIRYPLEYPHIMDRKRLTVLTIVAWYLGSMCGLGSSTWSKYDYTAGMCDLDWLGDDTNFIWVIGCYQTHVTYPCILIFYLNYKIIQMSKATKSSGGEMKKDKQGEANSKILLSMMIVVSAFFIFCVPMGTSRIVKISMEDSSAFPGWLSTSFHLWQYLASVVNPLVYAILRKDFRNAFIRLAKKIVRCNF